MVSQGTRKPLAGRLLGSGDGVIGSGASRSTFSESADSLASLASPSLCVQCSSRGPHRLTFLDVDLKYSVADRPSACKVSLLYSARRAPTLTN